MSKRLLDKKALREMHPAFKKYSLDWLIRKRAIPVVRVGGRIFFDEDEVDKWIETKKIPADTRRGK